MVFAGLDEALVAGGQGGVGFAGPVGGVEQGFAQGRVTGLGGWSVAAAGAGLVEFGDQAGE